MKAQCARSLSVQGFTLLEMMISVALLALIISLAYGSLRVAAQASRSGEALIERSEELRSSQVFLRRQLSQMMSVPYEHFDDNGEEKHFDGDGEQVTFVAPMPGYLSHGGAHVQHLALVRGDSGLELRFSNAQLNGYDPQRGIPDDPPPVVLIDGIEQGGFEFRQMQPDGVLADWSESFDKDLGAPVMLRLKLEFASSDRRNWPEFQVAMRSAGLNGGRGMGLRRPPGAPPSPTRPRLAP